MSLAVCKHAPSWQQSIKKNNLPFTSTAAAPMLRLNGHDIMGLPVGLLKGTIIRKAATKAQLAQATRIRALADKFEGRLKRSYLRAIKALKNDFDVPGTAALIQAGKIMEALKEIQTALEDHGLKAMTAEFNDAVIAGGKLAATIGHEQLHGEDQAHNSVNFVFDVANPATATFLQEYGANKITGLLDQTRQVVRTALEEGFSAGRNPISVARDIRSMIGLTPNQAKAVSNFRDVLENAGDGTSYSDYSGYSLRDARYDGPVDAAMSGEADLSAEKIETMVERYAQRTLNYRADTIGRTEGIGAVSAGNQQVWQQAVEDEKIESNELRRYWVYTDDDKVRDAHIAIPDMNPEGVGLDEPFESPLGEIMFPGDPEAEPANSINCRCVVIYQVDLKGN